MDIIIQHGHELIPIEIKSTHTFHPSLLNNLKFYQELVGQRCTKGFLIYAGEQQHKVGNFQVINYRYCSEIWDKIRD